MLNKEWPIFFSNHLFYGLVKVVLQNFDAFYCVELTVASNQSTYAIRLSFYEKHGHK